MNREELFELLEMDAPEDFEYFEQFAEMVECQEDIEFDDFAAALAGADSEALAEINENYFTEIEKGFPDNCDDFYEIFQEIKNNLTLLLPDLDDESYRREYVDQLYKFHQLYTKADGASVDGKACSAMEAVAVNRMAKLDGSSHEIDFAGCLDYTPDYISMRLGGYEDEPESESEY